MLPWRNLAWDVGLIAYLASFAHLRELAGSGGHCSFGLKKVLSLKSARCLGQVSTVWSVGKCVSRAA
jgi:hypothetical protein